MVRMDAGNQRQLGTATGMIRYTPGWDAPITDEELETLMEGCEENDSNCASAESD